MQPAAAAAAVAPPADATPAEVSTHPPVLTVYGEDGWSATQRAWAAEQARLRAQLVTQDELGFQRAESPPDASSLPPLTLVGGVDISFLPEPSQDACAALVVCQWPPARDGSMRLLYEDYQMVTLTEPYCPGFLAFREVPHLMRMLERLRARAPQLMPQLMLTDGNGLLHPRSSAAHATT